MTPPSRRLVACGRSVTAYLIGALGLAVLIWTPGGGWYGIALLVVAAIIGRLRA